MYILRSKNRANYEAYEPESISASSELPDLELAPVEMWEEVESLESVDAPKFGPRVVVQEVSIESEEVDVPAENVEAVAVEEVPHEAEVSPL